MLLISTGISSSLVCFVQEHGLPCIVHPGTIPLPEVLVTHASEFL